MHGLHLACSDLSAIKRFGLFSQEELLNEIWRWLLEKTSIPFSSAVSSSILALRNVVSFSYLGHDVLWLYTSTLAQRRVRVTRLTKCSRAPS